MDSNVAKLTRPARSNRKARFPQTNAGSIPPLRRRRHSIKEMIANNDRFPALLLGMDSLPSDGDGNAAARIGVEFPSGMDTLPYPPVPGVSSSATLSPDTIELEDDLLLSEGDIFPPEPPEAGREEDAEESENAPVDVEATQVETPPVAVADTDGDIDAEKPEATEAPKKKTRTTKKKVEIAAAPKKKSAPKKTETAEDAAEQPKKRKRSTTKAETADAVGETPKRRGAAAKKAPVVDEPPVEDVAISEEEETEQAQDVGRFVTITILEDDETAPSVPVSDVLGASPYADRRIDVKEAPEKLRAVIEARQRAAMDAPLVSVERVGTSELVPLRTYVHYEVEAPKSLLMLCGGACLAMLMFMGYLVVNGKVELARSLAMPLGTFFVALWCTCLSHSCSSIAQKNFATQRIEVGEKWQTATVVFSIVSYLICLYGIISAGATFTRF